MHRSTRADDGVRWSRVTGAVGVLECWSLRSEVAQSGTPGLKGRDKNSPGQREPSDRRPGTEAGAVV